MWLKKIFGYLKSQGRRTSVLSFDDDDSEIVNYEVDKLDDPSLPAGISKYEVSVNDIPQQIFYLTDKYNVGKILGKGGFGIVYAGKDTTKSYSPHVAIKCVTLKPDQKGEMILREIRILSRLKHPFILPMLDVMEYRPTSDGNGVVTYVMERMKHDTLQEIMNKQRQCFDISHIELVFSQMVRAVAHLHSMNILHRDLKPQNFLIGARNRVKLADFGHARGLDRLMTRRRGTPLYLPPEKMLLTTEDTYSSYSTASDMWALGVILGEMLGHNGPCVALFNALYPFRFHDNPQAGMAKEYLRVVPGPHPDDPMPYLDSDYVRNVVGTEAEARGPDSLVKFKDYFPKATMEAFDLFRRLLEFDPSKRISAQDALSHPFLADMNIQKLGSLVGLSQEEKRILSNPVSGYDLKSEINEKEIVDADATAIRELLVEESKKFHERK